MISPCEHVTPNRDRGRPHGLTPPTPPYIRVPYKAVRWLQSGTTIVSSSVTGALPPDTPTYASPLRFAKGSVSCLSGAVLRSSISRSLLPSVRAFGLRLACLLCPLLTPPLGSERMTLALSQFPWHATSRGTGAVSRGKRSYRRGIGARCMKHSPFVDGGLCCCVPARPDCATPHIGLLSVAPHLRSTLPSDPPHGDALALPLAFGSTHTWTETCTPKHDSMHGTHAKAEARATGYKLTPAKKHTAVARRL
jgi:hypothetical protein